MTAAQGSLFDKPPAAVLGGASDWIEAVLAGSLATSLCVIAIAILGFLLLTGRLRVRGSVEVVIGCFVLLGAGLMAAQLQHLWHGLAGQGAGREEIIVPQMQPRKPLPPARYDPYAGASLRR